MKKYHFSCGNSTKGPIGFCAEVAARSRGEAVSKLRAALVHALGPLGIAWINVDEPSIEYVNVYINPANLGVDEIED